MMGVGIGGCWGGDYVECEWLDFLIILSLGVIF